MNNKQYFFILGINPELSIAEIVSLLKAQSIDFTIDLAINSVFIINCAELPSNFFARLGGSKKFGVINDKLTSLDLLDLSQSVGEPISDSKFKFGFSLYNFSKSDIKKIKPKLKALGLAYKKELRGRDIKSRLVESKDIELSSVIVHKEKMIDHGIDCVLIKYKDEIFLGKTLVVQNYDAFSRRDYGKPSRDTTSGMLPPKLARIMLNLAKVEKTDVVLDPFCGSGTIILEALSLGVNEVYGSDKSHKAITDTDANIIWWQRHNVLSKSPQIKKISVENLNQGYKENSINAIITEPFLGPPLKGRETPEQINSIINELSELYKVALKQFSKVLKASGRVVMVCPVFVDKKGDRQFLNIFRSIKDLDFEIRDCLMGVDIEVAKPTGDRGTYYYCREGQKVCREILVLYKK